MDRKRAILDYICDERLDLLEELNETEVKLQETIVALPETQDLSAVMATYHSLAEKYWKHAERFGWIRGESVEVDF